MAAFAAASSVKVMPMTVETTKFHNRPQAGPLPFGHCAGILASPRWESAFVQCQGIRRQSLPPGTAGHWSKMRGDLGSMQTFESAEVRDRLNSHKTATVPRSTEEKVWRFDASA